nr:flagellar filament capping protein FliD [Sedimentibacter sp.]
MSTLSTSLYGSSSSKGFGGLVSGLDTDDLVNQMLAGTKSKINKQYQAKQRLLYRQEAYREISTKLVSFNNTYFSYSSGSSTNILSSKFFESYKYTSSSKYVNVTGNADNISNFSIDAISSVATSASFASNKKVTSGEFTTETLGSKTSTLAGATMTIEYDGKSYNLQLDKGFGNGEVDVTLESVKNEINEQLAKISGLNGVTASITADNKLSITGSKEVKLTAASSSVIDNLNMKVGQTAVSGEIDTTKLTKSTEGILKNTENYITFELNGVTKKINMDSSLTDAASLETYIQSKLDSAYGSGKVTADYDDITKKFTFSASSETDIFGVSSISTELSNYTGIETGDYNRVNKTRALNQLGLPGLEAKDTYQIKVNDATIDIKNTMSVTDIINTINSNAEAGVKVYYSSTTNTFTVKSTETGSHNGVSITDVDGGGNLAATLFGTGVSLNEGEHLNAVDEQNGIYALLDKDGAKVADVTFNSATKQYAVNYTDPAKTDVAAADYFVNAGTDTVMTYTLNGVQNTITRSTANFTIDDINLELNEKAQGLTAADEPITFDATNNADEVVEKVKKFIDTYNEIITLIGTKTSEKPNRDYSPLTPDQQEEMEEDEIKDWTAQAKKGILFGDNNMNNILRKMRQVVSGSTSVSGLTLSSIGISSATMDTSGKLVFDQEKFKEKLLENPEEIANLFSGTTSDTNGVSGIAVQMRELLVANVGSYGTTGILIDEAGLASGMTSDQNNISEKIKDYDDKMEELKDKMEDERERYWSQFSSLETTLNNLNSQSSWLTDMFS